MVKFTRRHLRRQLKGVNSSILLALFSLLCIQLVYNYEEMCHKASYVRLFINPLISLSGLSSSFIRH